MALFDHPAGAITSEIIGAAMEVHSHLGPGLLESAYESCLAYELRSRGFTVDTQLPLPVIYKEVQLDLGYRIDMLVNGAIVVELKAATKLQKVHGAQLLSYLRLSGHRVGLLMNFHELVLKDGIKRILN